MINIIFIQVSGIILIACGYIFGLMSNRITDIVVDVFPMTEEYFTRTRENPDALFYRDPIFAWFYEWNEWVKHFSLAISVVGIFLLVVALVELIKLNNKKHVAKRRAFSFSDPKVFSKN